MQLPLAPPNHFPHPLTFDEVEELVEAYCETPTLALRNQLVEAHSHMCLVLAQKYAVRYTAVGDEFLSVAMLELVMSVKRFPKVATNRRIDRYIYRRVQLRLMEFSQRYFLTTTQQTVAAGEKPGQRLIPTGLINDLTKDHYEQRFSRLEVNELCELSSKDEIDRHIFQSLREGMTVEEAYPHVGISKRQFQKRRERLFNHFIYLWEQ